MKIDLANIKDLAKNLLFENNINELRLPLDHDMDAGKNNRTSAKDQPGPQIDGEGNYEKSYEDLEDELPLVPSDIMPVFYDEKLSVNALDDEEYIPQNTSELMRASNTLIDRNKEELSSKEIELAWKTLVKIIKKAN
jgi:hypothetical protein|tara:strand:- start:71 stop:481 length:411 start_codon:yes stop_codon:yes gene_type:complete